MEKEPDYEINYILTSKPRHEFIYEIAHAVKQFMIYQFINTGENDIENGASCGGWTLVKKDDHVVTVFDHNHKEKLAVFVLHDKNIAKQMFLRITDQEIDDLS